MNNEPISKQLLAHYLAYVTFSWFDHHDVPPDELSELDSLIEQIRLVLRKYDDEDVMQAGLEQLLVNTPDEELEPLNMGLYPFDGEELREIFAYCYEVLFPEAELPRELPPITWSNLSWKEWQDQKPHTPKRS